MPLVTSIGSGPDALMLKVSQEAYDGDAQYVIIVDGEQINGVLTADAERRFGEQDSITVNGTFGPGPHTLTVAFLNDAWGGTTEMDRNLYIDAISFNGTEVPGATLSLFTEGPQSVGFGTGSGSGSGSNPRSETIGSGPDAVVLRISQDAFQGDARYTISIDGVQIGGALTASALHEQGESDTVTVLGNFTLGSHTVTVNFLNDAWGGSPALDRNLYVDSVSFEGRLLTDSTIALLTEGPRDVGSFSDASVGGSGRGAGLDTLILGISQDDWLGNAEFTVSVDGVPFGGVFTTNAERQFGQADTLFLSRSFGPGTHSIEVNFLNDAWGGAPDMDRNLYVESIAFNTVTLSTERIPIFSNGSQVIGNFTVPPLPPPLNLVGTDGPDRLQESLTHGDTFEGGQGADGFVFGIQTTMSPHGPGSFLSSTLGTGTGTGNRDIILDFQQGEDVIDVSTALQFARRALFTDTPFQFIGTEAFRGTTEAGGAVGPQLRYQTEGDRTIIQMDGSGLTTFSADGLVDAEIELAGNFTLAGSDFVL